MRRVPPALVPYLIAFVGTLGNIASDTAAVVIPPLGALVYLGVKKHPVAGMIVATPVRTLVLRQISWSLVRILCCRA